jgi:hypothetical protein
MTLACGSDWWLEVIRAQTATHHVSITVAKGYRHALIHLRVAIRLASIRESSWSLLTDPSGHDT